MTLESNIESIANRHDLAKFANLLKLDLIKNPEQWENVTLPDFLDAISAWVDDMDGYYINKNQPVPKSPSWKNIAEILLAAKHYE